MAKQTIREGGKKGGEIKAGGNRVATEAGKEDLSKNNGNGR